MTHHLTPEFFIPLFVAAWLAIGGLLSHLSGWRSLAQRFSRGSLADGERFRFASGSLGKIAWFPVRYANCLFVTVASSGFEVSIFLPFRFLCPPLFIPWSQVASIEEQQKFLHTRTAVCVQGSAIQLTLFGAAGRRVLASYRAALGLHADHPCPNRHT